MEYFYVLMYGNGQMREVLSVHHTEEHAKYQKEYVINYLGSHPDNLEIHQVPCPDQ